MATTIKPYASYHEFQFQCQGRPTWAIAQMTRRSVRTIERYLSGTQKIPWWIPEILRLQDQEYFDRTRQQGFNPIRKKLGIVTGELIEFPVKDVEPKSNKIPQEQIVNGQSELNRDQRNSD